jgi:arylsulfatase A-like enzyme
VWCGVVWCGGTVARAQIGRLLKLLKDTGVADNTAIFYTTDNGPHQVRTTRLIACAASHHPYFPTSCTPLFCLTPLAEQRPRQGLERTDIHYSTNFLRQCKASMWEV